MPSLHTQQRRLVRAIVKAQYISLEIGSVAVSKSLDLALVAAEAGEADRTPNPAA